MSHFDTLNEIALFLAPYLGLRPTQIFPFSSESAPFIFSVWLVLVSICYFGFVREGPGPNAIVTEAKKQDKQSVLKKLECLVFLENTRLAQQSTAGKAETSANDISLAGNKRPPGARYIFRHIFDKILAEPVSNAVGIAEDNPWFLRAGEFVHLSYCTPYFIQLVRVL